MREIKFIVIHCSATQVNRDYTPEQLDKDHKLRGFVRAGYHFYIRKSGEIVRLRPDWMVPAHVKGYNQKSMAICYEGGLDEKGKPADTRTKEQKVSLLALLKTMRCLYTEARVCGHRDLSADLNGDGVITPDEWIKQCPCFNARKEYRMI